MAVDWHVKWLAEGVDRWNQRRKKVEFSPDLSGVNFFELLPPDYRDSPKTSRYFEKINLSDSNLRNSNLSGLNFSFAKFKGSDLTQADLSRTNFSHADFSNAKFDSVRVIGSDFSNSKFILTYFDNSDFSSAILKKAIVAPEGIPEASLSSMRISGATVFRTFLEYKNSLSNEARPIKGAQTKDTPDDRSKKHRYDVFFGTNRDAVYERGALTGFGSELSDAVSYGICEVEIPDRRRIGDLGKPRWKQLLNRRDASLQIKRLISLSPELFWPHLQRIVGEQPIDSNPVIFVHGFNNSFESSVLRAAQVGFDLGVGEGIGLFSWPSKDSFFKYLADEASVETSKYALADFIETFTGNFPNRGVNIIAHSMGCRCLMLAIEVLAAKRKHVLQAIDHIVLTAADIASSVMPMQAGHAFGATKRLTSYVSNKDQALKWSGILHGGPRAGYTPPVFILTGMDTVQVNSDDLGTFAHAYVATSRSVLGDIFSMFRNNLPPSKRHGLVPAFDGTNMYWRMKD